MTGPRFGDKLLILRFSRLGRTPPALYGAELLAEAGLPVLAVEYGERKESQPFVDGKLPRLRLESPWVTWFPRALQSRAFFFGTLLQLILWCVRTERPKLIFAHGINEQVLAWYLHRLLGVPYAVHVHEAYEDSDLLGFNRWLLQREGPALRAAEFLVFPEKERREIYRERYGFTVPTFLVFNCPRRLGKVTPRDLRKYFHLPSDAYLVGYVGGLGRENVLDEAVEALAQVPQVYLILWGWAEDRFRDKLRAKAESLGVGARLIFGGLLQGDKWESLAGLDLSYCVYRPDSLRLKHPVTASNKLMESLAVGVPVLTSGEPGFVAFLKERPVGRALTDFSAEAIARAWVGLLADLPGRRLYGETGRSAHQADLNYETQFAEVIGEFTRRFKSN